MIVQISFFLLFISLLGYFQVKRLRVRQEKKEIAIYLALLGAGGLIGVLMLAGVEVPSPARPIRALFEPISALLFPKP